MRTIHLSLRLFAMKFKKWAGLVCLLSCIVCVAQQALTNESVMKMVKAGLNESVIVSMIESQPGNYTMTPDAVAALKQAGVTGDELAAMAVKGTTVEVSEQPQSSIYDNLDIGVYYKSDGKWVMLPSETVGWKTGGLFKNLATGGIMMGDVNGRLHGTTSSAKLIAPLHFLVRTPDGLEGTDFRLVYLHVRSHDREFRKATGGVLRESGDLSKDTVPCTQKKIARNTYEIILPDNSIPGEYAFLAPYSSGGQAGKAYTFHFDKQ